MGEARRGRRVLLVSTDPAHNLAHLFDRAVGPRPVPLEAGLDAVELDPDETVAEHLARTREALRRLMPDRLHGEIDRHLGESREAPGMVEAALLEAIAALIEEAAHDLIVFDTAPTGHTARLLSLPEAMAAWTEGLIASRERADRFAKAAALMGADRDEGREDTIRAILHRRRALFRHLREALTDEARTAFLIALTAERLPVLETIELHARLRSLGVAAPALLVNKRAPAGESAFLDALRAREDGHLATLRAALPEAEVVEIALQPQEVTGADALAALRPSGQRSA